MMRLSPAMTWSRHGSDLYVHGETQVLLLRDCPPEADSLMRLLETGCESMALEALDLEARRVADILDVLRQANCLVHNASRRWIGTSLERQADYFSALGADPDEVQSTLGSARVAILGVGGIGAVALAHLVSAGVSRYTLIDGDTVQPGNLNRQLIYRPEDVGRLKVEAAAEWVSRRNPAAVVRPVPRMLTDCSELASVLAEHTSLLVMAADTPDDIALRAARACLDTGTPLTSADCGLRTASWGPLLEPEDLQAYMVAHQNTRDRAPMPPAAAPMKASFGPTNAIAASYMVKDVLNWFAGLPVPSLRAKVSIDMEAMAARITSTQEVFADTVFDAPSG
jgi:sulfur-carrier protein adenylyltransferase/sulfurtransferase